MAKAFAGERADLRRIPGELPRQVGELAPDDAVPVLLKPRVERVAQELDEAREREVVASNRRPRWNVLREDVQERNAPYTNLDQVVEHALRPRRKHRLVHDHEHAPAIEAGRLQALQPLPHSRRSGSRRRVEAPQVAEPVERPLDGPGVHLYPLLRPKHLRHTRRRVVGVAAELIDGGLEALERVGARGVGLAPVDELYPVGRPLVHEHRRPLRHPAVLPVL